jgi:holliday junction DNA helicase RuvA
LFCFHNFPLWGYFTEGAKNTLTRRQEKTQVLSLLALSCTLKPMIGSLRGRVIEIHANHAFLEVGGVGYKILAAPSVLSKLQTDREGFLYIHEHIREDSDDLYGFLSYEDLELFEQLLDVSGVGPKVGMTILSVGSADMVRKAIMAGDIDLLTSVPGVGKKTAQKIVLELKGQLVDIEGTPSQDREVVEALESLGYSSSQAREAIKRVSAEVTNVSDRVREALRLLSK